MQPFLRRSFKARKSIAKNYGKKMEVCRKCKKWVLFKDEIISEDQRKKVCPYCAWSRVFEIARAEFKTGSNGETLRKDKGVWVEVDWMFFKDGIQLLPVWHSVKNAAPQLKQQTFFPF